MMRNIIDDLNLDSTPQYKVVSNEVIPTVYFCKASLRHNSSFFLLLIVYCCSPNFKIIGNNLSGIDSTDIYQIKKNTWIKSSKKIKYQKMLPKIEMNQVVAEMLEITK